MAVSRESVTFAGLINESYMSKKNNGQPAMAWLKMPGYMIAWLEGEYGGSIERYGHKLLSFHHVDGVRRVLKMETEDDTMVCSPEWQSLSQTRMECIQAGMGLNPDAIEAWLGVSPKQLAQYVLVECPHLALTQNGVLRPWTRDIAFSRPQARRLQAELQRLFWSGVDAFDARYADAHPDYYPAVEMVTAFCDETGTEEIYIQEIRREFQRKRKRNREN